MKKKLIILLGCLVLIFVILIILLPIKGKLAITSNPENIQVIINNQTYSTPIIIKLKKGTYKVTGKKDGYFDNEQTTIIKAFKTTKLLITLSSRKNIEPTNSNVPGIVSKFPFENNHFYINWDWDKYSLIIIPNFDFKMGDNPNEVFAKGWSTYEQYAKEALDWLSQNGLSSKEIKDKQINIEWWGQEWWPTGKTISF